MSRNKKKEKHPVLEQFLQYIATLQAKHMNVFLIFFIVLTLFLGYGLTMIAFESDMNNEMPQQLPIYQLNNKVTNTFGGQDAVIILFELDPITESPLAIKDIRDDQMIKAIIKLHSLLEKESMVDKVTSASLLFSQVPDAYLTDEGIISLLKENPELASFFSDDLTATVMVVTADVGSSEEKLAALNAVIEKNMASVPSVPGVSYTVTGSPSVLQTIMDLLRHDSLFTLAVAALIILILLFILEHSFLKAVLIFIPLLLGIIWTLGTMGWLQLKISVATAGLGAMLLGLGVEYGVFMLTRYVEERKKGVSQADALFVAVPSVGSAMLGSGLTTIVGFLALTLSIMPMLQHLGQSLALGILFCLIAAIFLAPVVFVLEENIEYKLTHRKYHRIKKKKEALLR